MANENLFPGGAIRNSQLGLQIAKLRQRLNWLKTKIYTEVQEVSDISWSLRPDYESCSQVAAGRFGRIKLPFSWERPNHTAWFRLRFKVPLAWRGGQVELCACPGGQAVIYHKGSPVQGLDTNHDVWLLKAAARGGEKYDILIETGSRNVMGFFSSCCFEFARLGLVNEPLRNLWYDLDTLMQLAEELSPQQARLGRVVAAVNRVMADCPYDRGPEDLTSWARKSRKELASVLGAVNGSSNLDVSLCGHAHIDVAWKWPLAETIRKCSRSFSTVLGLMEQHPDFVFTQSQPQLYEYTRQHYPQLFRRILKRIKENRWEAAAGMWVESDCNLAGAEGLVRQVLHGKRYMREVLGVDHPVCWLPDVFGFPASMPQILAKGGLPFFYTIKVDWSESNIFPHPSFWWRGIDGSKVLAHLGCNPDGYNGKVRAKDLKNASQWALQRDPQAENGLFAFGYGDGGGGPTPEMLEFAQRTRDLEGLPRTRMERCDTFFKRLASEEGQRLPEWAGELYLELHRGTFTSQARTKRDNRKAELALREAEFFATLAMTGGKKYPRASLDAAWKLVLLNHFHDILPGSSIAEVYAENLLQYQEVFQRSKKIINDGISHLARRLDTRGVGQALVVSNVLNWPRGGVVEIAAPSGPCSVRGPSGNLLASQRCGRKLLVKAQQIPAMGAAVWHMGSKAATQCFNPLKANERLLENDLLRVRFDARGLISSIYEKTCKREVLPAGQRGNLLQLFDDRPRQWDAWDIDQDFEESCRDLTELVSVKVIERGPVRAALRFTREFGHSRLVQDVRLSAGSALLEFVTRVSWREDQKLLKVAFPVDVLTDRATYEIQFGVIERSVHRGGRRESAAFEVPAHRWADLSEPDFGMSLLNDCKYGYDCRGNLLRLSLLRSSIAPDPQADRGEQQFTYAIYPHAGDWRQALSVQAGLELNLPLRIEKTCSNSGKLGSSFSFLWFDAPNVIVEAVKAAENSDQVTLRMYESQGRRASGKLQVAMSVMTVLETNLLEQQGRVLPVKTADGHSLIDLEFAPFEIKTLLLH
jgi:alpha-mannosidase